MHRGRFSTALAVSSLALASCGGGGGLGGGAENWLRLATGLGRITAVPIGVSSQSLVFTGTQGGGVYRRE